MHHQPEHHHRSSSSGPRSPLQIIPRALRLTLLLLLVVCLHGPAWSWQGSAHGSTAEQFKRTTVLEVEHAFPYCTSRQPVKRRSVTVQSPIECALDDVRQRCRVIRELMAKPNDKINKNTMMQLLQGSVVPQVRPSASHSLTD